MLPRDSIFCSQARLLQQIWPEEGGLIYLNGVVNLSILIDGNWSLHGMAGELIEYAIILSSD